MAPNSEVIINGINAKTQRLFAYLAVFALGLLVPVIFAHIYAYPVPHVHDEFAYLLQGDTFSHGRLTNPTHSLFRFFETFHVFFNPTYQAKYPPGQGFFLAIGEFFFSHPAIGVWISLAFACVALTWMLNASVSLFWSVLITVLFLLNPVLFVKWSQTYWGGYVAFIGGALYFGALIRLIDKEDVSCAVILMIGVFILSISRPAEGLLMVLLSFPYLIYIRIKKFDQDDKAQYSKIIIALLIGAIGITIFHLYYNYIVSKDFFTLPYSNWTFRDSNIEVIQSYTGSPPLSFQDKVIRLYHHLFPHYSGFLLLSLFFIKINRTLVLILLLICVQLVVSSLYTRGWPHYFAPSVPLYYLVLGLGLDSLSGKSIRGIHIGKYLAFIGFIAIAMHSSLTLAYRAVGGPSDSWGRERMRMIDSLSRSEPKDLIFVRYGSNHNLHTEWVYNQSDIDGSHVVWARDLGDGENKKLMSYYPDRKVWLLEPDNKPIELTPYPNE
jgi:hypothetical protein